MSSRTLLLPVLLTLALAPSLARAEAGDEEESEESGIDWTDWIPSIGPGFGVYSRDFEARAGSATPDIIQCTGEQNPDNEVIPGNPTCRFFGLRTQLLAPSPFSFGITQPVTYQCTATAAGPFRVPPLGPGWCGPYDGQSDEALDGASVAFHTQLLGPAFRFLPAEPRLLFQGGFALPQDSRVLAADGLKARDYPTAGQDPRLRIELNVKPQQSWWIGGGVAFRLPIDRYTVRAKLSVHYTQEDFDTVGSISQALRPGITCTPTNLNRCDTDLVYTDTSGNTVVPGLEREDQPEPVNEDGVPIRTNLPVSFGDYVVGTVQAGDDVTIRSITPSVGLEVDVAQFGPVMVGVSADTFLSVALSDVGTSFGLSAPGQQGSSIAGVQPSGPGAFSLQGDDLHIFGVISVRFSWMGFDR
jgi:hypothetical protein